MGRVRIRVVFEDGLILSKSQKSEGLKRSWLLLQPQHKTICDVSSYLARFFDLGRSCPYGIVLYVDDFVLPPSESTCILKDKDVIRVHRKEGMLRDAVEAVEVGNGLNLSEQEVVEKQPDITSVPHLWNEKFDEETSGYQSEPEEEEYTLLSDSEKRRASRKLQIPKEKKKRTVVPQDDENDFQMEQNEGFNNDGLHYGKGFEKKEKAYDVRSKPGRASTSRNGDRNDDNVDHLSRSKRLDKLEENGEGCVDVSQMPRTSEDILQWNGITSKKRGEKEGKGNSASTGGNDFKASNKECFEMMATDNGKPPNAHVDFDGLTPLNRLPMEGEVIAYRLVELSSSWSSTLSSFRVGKTSWCDPKSKRILLTPLAKYPIILESGQDDDENAQSPDNSPYAQDGSLKISFMSLMDVRIVNNGNSEPAKATPSNEATAWTVGPSNNYKQKHAPTQGNEVNAWDKYIRAQSIKKAHVSHVNSGNNENSGTRSSSDRALRSSVRRGRKDI